FFENDGLTVRRPVREKGITLRFEQRLWRATFPRNDVETQIPANIPSSEYNLLPVRRPPGHENHKWLISELQLVTAVSPATPKVLVRVLCIGHPFAVRRKAYCRCRD